MQTGKLETDMKTEDSNERPWLFKKGQSGNPNGRPMLTEEERQMRENFKKSFAMLGNMSLEEIKQIAADPKQPAAYAIAAKALEWAFKNGNPALYREIWDRTLGKVQQNIEITNSMSSKDPELKEKAMRMVANSNLMNDLKKQIVDVTPKNEKDQNQ